MTYNFRKDYDPKNDLIIPCMKDLIDQDRIYELTGLKSVDFDGTFETYIKVGSKAGSRIYLLGLGEKEELHKSHESIRNLVFKEMKYWDGEVQVEAVNIQDENIESLVLGIELARYQIGQYKSEEESTTSLPNWKICLISKVDIGERLKNGFEIGRTINRIKYLVDAPPNIKTPIFISDWAIKSAQANGYACEVWDEARIESEGLHALLSVGKGSENPPRFVICSYLPKEDKKVDLGFVGKGITFDSGGLSIKPSTNLHYMKSDMGGAAAVLGAIELIAKLKLDINVIAVVPTAENAVDANSYRPGDVIKSYSGKSIEVIDTDAEGRLALADGLSYLNKNHKPEVLIDVATLTGSVVRTLGYSAAGIFSKNRHLVDQFFNEGAKIHEPVWHLPMFDELEKDLQSDIADIRNFSGRPVAGASAAAKFLEAFTDKHDKWVHLDIAGMAFGASSFAKMKSASGFGARLLVSFAKQLIDERK